MIKKIFFPSFLLLLFFFSANAYGYEDDIGYTALKNRLGGATPDGTGIPVVQVEANFDTPPIYKYLPDTSDSEFFGKTFSDKTGSSTGVSSHATGVGRNFFGNTTSIAPGITGIWNYEAGDFIVNVLKVTSSSAPEGLGDRRIINNSWIGSVTPDVYNTKTLTRIDDVVDSQNIVVVAGVNNGAGSSMPKLLSSAYNVIAVGRSDGVSSYGPTTIDTPGRAKPDIVAPLGSTSAATPVVGAAAALLLEEGQNRAWTNSQEVEVVKSLLMAGAEKLPGWHKGNVSPGDDTSVPLDWQQGAGSLRIDRSYDILVAGEQEASNAADVAIRGWDFDSLGSGETKRYFFDIGATGLDFQAALTWNREITSYGDGETLDGTLLRNLDLTLREAIGYTPGSLIQESISTIDNVEYIYLDNLSAGRYTLEVMGNLTGGNREDYSLSWAVIPEPSTIILLGSGLAGLVLARRKRCPVKNGKV